MKSWYLLPRDGAIMNVMIIFNLENMEAIWGLVPNYLVYFHTIWLQFSLSNWLTQKQHGLGFGFHNPIRKCGENVRFPNISYNNKKRSIKTYFVFANLYVFLAWFMR